MRFSIPTVSFTCPEKWQIESSGILNDDAGKRIGERVFREDFSFEEFVKDGLYIFKNLV